MSLDCAIQKFMNNIDNIYWRDMKNNDFVKYYYAEDNCYVFKVINGLYTFSKGRSPSAAWKKLCDANIIR